jgi:ketosteroid isomerase-like protein
MNAAENKKLLQYVFAEAKRGNIQPFLDALSDDIEWTINGTLHGFSLLSPSQARLPGCSGHWQIPFSRTFRSKQVFISELVEPLMSQIAGNLTFAAQPFIGDDYVSVEARGHSTTKTGMTYNNTYCMLFRLSGNKIQQVTAYMDIERTAG